MQITDQTLIATIRTLAAVKGEHVYSNPVPPEDRTSACLYVHDAEYTESGNAEPGCIIGTALNVLGVSLNDLADNEGEGAMSLIRSFSDYVPHDVQEWAGHVQVQQDSGQTWADSVRSADEFRPLSF